MIRLILSIVIFTAIAVPSYALERKLPASKEQVQLSFAPLVKEVSPAVVNIYTKKIVKTRVSPFFSDPFFERFFGRGFGGGLGRGGMTRERVEQSLGSGVIVDADGLIITNAHVIDGADDVTVMLKDGKEYKADVKIVDKPSDLALLRIDGNGEDLPYIELKPSDVLEVGDIVLAIGNPFGVGQTVTSGIVSALARSSLNINDFNFFIQTDAAINPGNSGGPLVSLDGKIVGINSAIYSRDGGSLGIGFAIPSEIVETVITAEKNGNVSKRGIIRPWAGVSVQTVTSDIADSLGLKHPIGALVSDLHSESPLRDAGIRKGDVITEVNGRAVNSPAEMKFRLAMVPIGKYANVTYLRNNRENTDKVKSIAPPDKPDRDETTLNGNHPFDDVTVSNINPAVVEELGLDSTTEDGVVVTNIPARSYASRLGLEVGAIIREVNDDGIRDVSELKRTLLREGSKDESWSIKVEQNGRVSNIVLR